MPIICPALWERDPSLHCRAKNIKASDGGTMGQVSRCSWSIFISMMNLKWKYFTSSGQPLKQRLTQHSAALRSLSPSLIKIWLETFHIYLQRSWDCNKQAQFAWKESTWWLQIVLLQVSVWHLKNWPITKILAIFFLSSLSLKSPNKNAFLNWFLGAAPVLEGWVLVRKQHCECTSNCSIRLIL